MRVLHKLLAAVLMFMCNAPQCALLQFMFIRNRKAASTTVQDNFEKCSYKIADPELCIEELSMEHFKRMNLDPEKAWKEYFVFSTARNPWARAGSSYDYCSTKWFSQVSTSAPLRQHHARHLMHAAGHVFARNHNMYARSDVLPLCHGHFQAPAHTITHAFAFHSHTQGSHHPAIILIWRLGACLHRLPPTPSLHVGNAKPCHAMPVAYRTTIPPVRHTTLCLPGATRHA